VSLLGAGARQLLKLLEQDDVARADVFRQLHERGRSQALLDVLTDLSSAAASARRESSQLRPRRIPCRPAVQTEWTDRLHRSVGSHLFEELRERGNEAGLRWSEVIEPGGGPVMNLLCCHVLSALCSLLSALCSLLSALWSGCGCGNRLT
jgi:hypothetical protein